MHVIVTYYVESIGGCRGGDSPGNHAGMKDYKHRECKKLCDADTNCGGYVLPVDGGNWCVTYTSKGVTGDGRKEFKCWAKGMKYI